MLILVIIIYCCKKLQHYDSFLSAIMKIMKKNFIKKYKNNLINFKKKMWLYSNYAIMQNINTVMLKFH